MTDIFREVDEDLKRDALDKIWAKYGSWIIGVAVLFVAVVAGLIGWSNYQADKQTRLSDEFMKAEKLALEGKSGEAMAAYDAIVGKTTSGYKTLAMFQKASLLVDEGKTQEGADLYDEIAIRGTGDEVLRELAKLKAAWALADTISYGDMQARMTGMATSDGSWQVSAREVLAYSAHRAGDLDAARLGYGGLVNNPSTPQGVAQRASAMLSIIGPIMTPVEPNAVTESEDVPSGDAVPAETPVTDETAPASDAPSENQ